MPPIVADGRTLGRREFQSGRRDLLTGAVSTRHMDLARFDERDSASIAGKRGAAARGELTQPAPVRTYCPYLYRTGTVAALEHEAFFLQGAGLEHIVERHFENFRDSFLGTYKIK